jgi:hypothetical protein
MDFVEQKAKRKQKRLAKSINNSKSLMQTHSEKMEYFEFLQDVVLPKKQAQFLKLKGQDYELVSDIKKIIDREEEIEYHLNTARIISDFVDIEESIDTTSIFQDVKTVAGYNYAKNKLIDDYFIAINENRPLLNRNLDRVRETFCESCKSEMIEGYEGYVCSNCGTCDKEIYISEKPSYKETQEYERKVVIDYKRLNYFTEWLNQIQGKEQTVIPEELITLLLSELKTEKISDTKKLNVSSMKRLLKKIGYSKFYEHIPRIINSLNGVKPLSMPRCVEDKLKFMFNEIQEPWEECKPSDRNNFFSYPYILYKFFQLLGMNEFLPYVTLLKSREKLYKQDVLWKSIITQLQQHSRNDGNEKLYSIPWRFISSV